DGTSSAGVISGPTGGPFAVTGDHFYADEGQDSITVIVGDDAPGTATATAVGTANDAESDALRSAAVNIGVNEGQAFSGVVASFTDPGFPGQVAADFTATIDWGDSTTTAGTVSGPTGGPFSISGTHTYADEGAYTVNAVFADDAPSILTNITIASTANVA